MKALALAAPLLAIAVLGCARELPPPAPPPQELPMPMPTDPIEVGRSRVMIDTPGETSAVARVIGTRSETDYDGNSYDADVTRNVCRQTPCVVDARKGHQVFLLSSLTVPRHDARLGVDVDDRPTVARHLYDDTHRGTGYTAGAVLALIGACLAPTGAIMAGVGAGTATAGIDPNLRHPPAGNYTVQDIGLGITIGGGVLLVGGAVWMIAARGTHRPGATTIFTTATAPRPEALAAPPAPFSF